MSLNGPHLCYLTDEAAKAVKELASLGIDEDLALAILERLWPETEIYDV